MKLKSVGIFALLSSVALVNANASDFVKVPVGSFKLGEDNKYISVKVTKPFYIAKSEMTLGEFKQYKPTHVNKAYTECDEDKCPVSNIGFGDTLKYIDWYHCCPAVFKSLNPSLTLYPARVSVV